MRLSLAPKLHALLFRQTPLGRWASEANVVAPLTFTGADFRRMENMKDDKKTDGDWEVIASYSRRQALDDGLLVDASNVACEAGIRYPVALTRCVFERCVTVPPGVPGQDLEGRLWDVVWMLSCAIRQKPGGREIRFGVFVKNDLQAARRVELKAVCGPDDDLSPCITVMAPEED